MGLLSPSIIRGLKLVGSCTWIIYRIDLLRIGLNRIRLSFRRADMDRIVDVFVWIVKMDWPTDHKGRAFISYR
jgi:hypothetical protein